MYKLRDKIQLILKQLESGAELKLKSGHVLVIPEGHEEPGFLSKVYRNNALIEENFVIQIGSETAWMMLIDHAKGMSREDCIGFILNNTNVNIR